MISRTSTQHDAPRFTLGQQVRVISNAGGLYSAQIGVVGVIARKRQYRRWGYHTYDVGYKDEKGRDKSLTSVREDDLEVVAEIPDTITTAPATTAQPRFAIGQRVRVINTNDRLAGVVGSTVRKRETRRWDQHTYDFAYNDAERGEVLAYGVREDDLEVVTESGASVTDSGASVTPAEPSTSPEQPAPFQIGQRVTVRPAEDGAEDDEYPSFTRYPVVGEIASACLVTADGVHCYDVRFPRIERGVSTESWPPVSIREAHLQLEPSQVGWMAHEAAMARTKASQKAPEKPPTFSIGEHVTVHPHSALCYETFTRKGAVGVITEIGKPVRGIRRYTVRFDVSHLGGSRDSRIREEHLVQADAPAPRQYVKPRHAYEYREEKQRQGERLWCDAGGCFEEACAICQQHPAPPIWTSPQMPYSTAALAALQADDTYEFAVALVRDKLEHGVRHDAVLAWQADRQWIYTVGGGTCYDVARGGFYVTMIRGQKCSVRYALKALLADAERRITGAPQQVSLWSAGGSEVGA